MFNVQGSRLFVSFAARPSRNQIGLVLFLDRPASEDEDEDEKFARPATIPTDTDRVCRAQGVLEESTTSTAQPINSFAVDSLRVRVYERQDQLVQDAGREAQSFLQETLLAQGGATAILATGNSQIRFLEQLVKLGGLDWSKITLFHMDEY